MSPALSVNNLPDYITASESTSAKPIHGVMHLVPHCSPPEPHGTVFLPPLPPGRDHPELRGGVTGTPLLHPHGIAPALCWGTGKTVSRVVLAQINNLCDNWLGAASPSPALMFCTLVGLQPGECSYLSAPDSLLQSKAYTKPASSQSQIRKCHQLVSPDGIV